MCVISTARANSSGRSTTVKEVFLPVLFHRLSGDIEVHGAVPRCRGDPCMPEGSLSFLGHCRLSLDRSPGFESGDGAQAILARVPELVRVPGGDCVIPTGSTHGVPNRVTAVIVPRQPARTRRCFPALGDPFPLCLSSFGRGCLRPPPIGAAIPFQAVPEFPHGLCRGKDEVVGSGFIEPGSQHFSCFRAEENSSLVASMRGLMPLG